MLRIYGEFEISMYVIVMLSFFKPINFLQLYFLRGITQISQRGGGFLRCLMYIDFENLPINSFSYTRNTTSWFSFLCLSQLFWRTCFGNLCETCLYMFETKTDVRKNVNEILMELVAQSPRLIYSLKRIF